MKRRKMEVAQELGPPHRPFQSDLHVKTEDTSIASKHAKTEKLILQKMLLYTLLNTGIATYSVSLSPLSLTHTPPPSHAHDTAHTSPVPSTAYTHPQDPPDHHTPPHASSNTLHKKLSHKHYTYPHSPRASKPLYTPHKHDWNSNSAASTQQANAAR